MLFFTPKCGTVQDSKETHCGINQHSIYHKINDVSISVKVKNDLLLEIH